MLPPLLPWYKRLYVTPIVALQPIQIDSDLVHLGLEISLDQIKAECPSFTYQEAATLESTALSAFQTVSWLDLRSTVVVKIFSTAMGD